MEVADDEFFDIVSHGEEANLHRCKYCKEEFSFPLRDLEGHKDQCPEYRRLHGSPIDNQSHEGMANEVVGDDERGFDSGVGGSSKATGDDDEAGAESEQAEKSDEGDHREDSPKSEEGSHADGDDADVSDHIPDNVSTPAPTTSERRTSDPSNYRLHLRSHSKTSSVEPDEPDKDQHQSQQAKSIHGPSVQHDSSVDHSPPPPHKRQGKRKNGSSDNLNDGQAQVRLGETTSGTDPIRRSKRVKISQKGGTVISGNNNVLKHFDLTDISARMKKYRCKFCDEECASSATANRHLEVCDEFQSRQERFEDLQQKLGHLADSQATEPTGNVVMQALGVAVTSSIKEKGERSEVGVHVGSDDPVCEMLNLDNAALIAWLYGSTKNAETMKQHYRHLPCHVLANPARFQSLEKDCLFGLDVKQLLRAASYDIPDMEILFQSNVNDSHRCTLVPVSSQERAWELFQCGHSVAFSPPPLVSSIVISTLAADLNVGPFTNSGAHEIKMICSYPQRLMDWQVLCTDSFAICLRGKLLWKLKACTNSKPFCSFRSRAFNTADAEKNAIAQRLAAHSTGSQKFVSPPFDETFSFVNEDEDLNLEDSDSGYQEFMVEPGSAVYVPAGYWQQVDGIENAVWLHTQLHAVTYADLMVDVVRQVIWANPRCREPVVFPSNATKVARQHLQVLINDVAEQVKGVKPADVLPELMVDEDSHKCDNVSGNGARIVSRSFEFDLRNRDELKLGKALKIYRGSSFRVNPLAILLREDELAYARTVPPASTAKTDQVAQVNQKKALTRKNKRRAHTATSLQRTAKFILHVGCGNPELRSRLRVAFRCSSAQVDYIEWIRSRDPLKPFHVNDFPGIGKEGDSRGGAENDSLKLLLRFLCASGYLTHVKIPL